MSRRGRALASNHGQTYTGNGSTLRQTAEDWRVCTYVYIHTHVRDAAVLRYVKLIYTTRGPTIAFRLRELEIFPIRNSVGLQTVSFNCLLERSRRPGSDASSEFSKLPTEGGFHG